MTYIWDSINPVNDLVYGYGGVKLMPGCAFWRRRGVQST